MGRVRHMRSIARAMLVLACAVVLVGCTAAPVPTSDPTTLWSPGPCLGEVSYPELPVWELNAALPVDGVAIEYVQYEFAVGRGPGSCSGSGVQPVDAECPVQTSPAELTLDVMLGYNPDELTVSEYALGATGAIRELVTGHSANDGFFQYRMAAWHYDSQDAAEQTKIIDIVEACDGAIQDGAQVAVYEGDEPHRIAYLAGENVYLIESIRSIAPDGRVAHIDDTASGLLPAEAIAMIREWWTAQVTAYYESGSSAA
jgi:hypothetical protein